MERVKNCRQCGRERKTVALGLCSACYHRQRRRKIVERRLETTPDDFVVRLDFQPMTHLLEELRIRAGAELRDLGRQILWELNKNFEMRA